MIFKVQSLFYICFKDHFMFVVFRMAQLCERPTHTFLMVQVDLCIQFSLSGCQVSLISWCRDIFY